MKNNIIIIDTIHEEYNEINNNCKPMKFFGCGKYESNPPICCRMLKRIGICYMINRYFKKRNARIHSEKT